MSIEYEREYKKLVTKLETFGVFTDLSDPTREFNHIRGITTCIKQSDLYFY